MNVIKTILKKKILSIEIAVLVYAALYTFLSFSYEELYPFSTVAMYSRKVESFTKVFVYNNKKQRLFDTGLDAKWQWKDNPKRKFYGRKASLLPDINIFGVHLSKEQVEQHLQEYLLLKQMKGPLFIQLYHVGIDKKGKSKVLNIFRWEQNLK